MSVSRGSTTAMSGHERVVDERQLAAAGGQHRRRGDLRAGARRRRHGDEPDRVVDLRVVGHALAGVEERQGQLGERQLRALVEQAHRLGGVEHGASADGDDQVRPQLLQHVDAGADLLLGGLGLDLREHADRAGEVTAHLVGHAARLGVGVGDQERLGAAQAAQLLERAGVEVGVRRDAEPLRRRLPARDGLDVEQVAVVDVLGGVRAAPGAAAEREGRRHRVVDAAEGADRRRRVDEDPAGADGRGERVDHGLVGRVDRGGVPHPAVLEHDLGGAQRVLDRRRADESEHRHELLVHERVDRERVEIGRQRCKQDLVVGARRRSRRGRRAPRTTGRARPARDARRRRTRPPPARTPPRRTSSRAPMRWSSASVASQTASSMMQVCSAGQISDESKVFEISMSTTAIGTSALRWM